MIGGRAAGRLLLLLLLWVHAPPSSAEAPTVEHLFPAGLLRNHTQEITVAGKFDPWPPRVWVSCPGLTFSCDTNKNRFQVAVDANTPSGPHLVRFYNSDGATAPRIFVVSDGPESLEVEPNDRFDHPQKIDHLPITVNGRLNKSGDVDSFAISLAADQWLETSVDAYTLASKLDALLRIVTPDGVQQAWNHDFTSLDPQLCWRAPSNGTYIVQVMGFKYPADADVRLAGGDGCVYRLHLATSDRLRPVVSIGPAEREPNDSLGDAAILPLPAVVRGVIGSAEDQDWFGFRLTKDDILEVTVEAASLGSPLVPWVKLADAQGRELAHAEEFAPFRDPRVEYKAATNGPVYAAVGAVFHDGGATHEYGLVAHRVQPECRATIASDALTVTAGHTNQVQFKISRLGGFKRMLRAKLIGLPERTHAATVEVPAEGTDVTLNLIADLDATAAQVPVSILLMDPVSSEQRAVLFSLLGASENNGVPGGYTRLLVESTDVLWLTVKAAQ